MTLLFQHDPLMEKLLHDIESYSIRNLELHKKSDQIIAENLQKQDGSSTKSKVHPEISRITKIFELAFRDEVFRFQ